MSNTLSKIQDEIIKEFSYLHDWFDKYNYLITLGKHLVPLDESLKNEDNALSGCQSQVWITAMMKGENIYFIADSDSLIIKGMISLLFRVVNNQHPKDVVDADLYFIEKIGLNSQLSPTRVNGLASIVRQIKEKAQLFLTI
jgi:cysteine desulfuration protein SufE